jgi:uncharacterized surface protein with fasciclin (FAS1) repeats
MQALRVVRTAALVLTIGTLAVAVPAAAQAPAQNVLDALKAAGTFTSFVKAIEEADMASLLTGTTPVTVLAPTDEAFAKVPRERLDAAMANKDQLSAILKNHIIEGERITIAQLRTQQMLKTAAGHELPIRVEGETPAIGDAKVTREIEAANGVIHVVDAVLLPSQ